MAADSRQKPTKREGGSDDKYEERCGRCEACCHWIQVFVIDTVGFEWLSLIIANKVPFEIWKALQNQFDRENSASFHSQFASSRHCESPPNPTSPPPSQSSTPNGLVSILAALQHGKPTSSPYTTTPRASFAPHRPRPHTSSKPSHHPCPTSRTIS